MIDLVHHYVYLNVFKIIILTSIKNSVNLQSVLAR